MAIPENYIDKITKDGESRDICPAADKVRVGNENFDGTNLDDVLNEIAEEMDNAGDGTVTGVKVGDTTYDPTEGVVDLSTPFGGKVDKVSGKGLSTNDYTTDEKSKLGNLPTADQLTQQMNSKANSTEVIKSISVNGTAQQKDANGNVNVVVPTVTLDDAPTAGSNNGVKSGGVKTALDNLLANLHIVNGEWYIGNTATGVSAQGPAGNVNITDASQLVAILVNDLTTGGAGNILSAEMGKVLKIAISTLIDSMGEYCFPNGRPTLSWEGPKCNITQNLTSDVTSNFVPSRIDKNGSLYVTLTPVDNLHVFLTGDVTVEMPLGTDITSTAWNANTGKVTIANVTDDVVITAKSSTYVQSGLVLMLDGKNQGETADQWQDIVNSNSSMVLSGGYTKNTDNVAFGGVDGEGIMSGFATDMPWDSASLESVVSFGSIPSAATFVFGFGNNHNTLFFVNKSTGNNRIYLASQIKGEHSNVSSGLVSAFLDSGAGSPLFAANEVVSLSRQGTTFKLNNTALITTNDQDSYIVMGDATSQYDASGKVFAGTFTTRLGAQFAPFAGKIYCVRAYSRTLTPNEVAHNYAIDQKRFNIA